MSVVIIDSFLGDAPGSSSLAYLKYFLTLLSVISRNGIERLVCITGIYTQNDPANPRWITMLRPFMRSFINDMVLMENTVMQSNLIFTIMRPPFLTNVKFSFTSLLCRRSWSCRSWSRVLSPPTFVGEDCVTSAWKATLWRDDCFYLWYLLSLFFNEYLKRLCHGCLVHFVDTADDDYSLWNLALAKKLLVNEKITTSCQRNMSPKHHIKRYKQQR